MALYGTYRATAFTQHADHLSGAENGLICIVSSLPLGSDATNALTKSFEALGYGPDPCTFLTLQSRTSSHVGMEGEPGQAPKDSLTAKDLFSVVEALDPVIVVSCDQQATNLLSTAYRQALPPFGSAKIFGRFGCFLPGISTMLATDKGKQQVWAHLKALPVRTSPPMSK